MFANYPNIARLVAGVTQVWPKHSDFLRQRFGRPGDTTLPLCEQIAGLILQFSAGDLSLYCQDYRWMCNMFIKEDLHFRRTGAYRLSSSAEADREVYSRPEFMLRYLRGILLSQALWVNQTDAFQFYLDSFLSRLEPGSRFLEIGPGHGLLVYFAGACTNISTISGWDISDSSIAMTQKALTAFGFSRPCHLRKRDILQTIADKEVFDAVVISEVLEHLDQPDLAMETITRVARPGGLVFFNVPINSPAPDHVFNWYTVDQVNDFVSRHGFEITSSVAVPMTGYDLDRALRRKVTVNVLIVGKKRK